jgi:choline-sulfatase
MNNKEPDKPDILVFMTDQHTPYYSGFMGNNVDTPNMDRLCREGTWFSQAYTPCPLCVPSRISMLTGLRPAHTGVFTLTDALSDLTPTFLHYFVEHGYETVLAGRMHFLGKDQRHGFLRRIAGDTTPVTWNVPKTLLSETRGIFMNSYGEYGATSFAGGGESPVEAYDKYVMDAAVKWLRKPHEKPQMIFVNLYGPHFPYVGRKDLYIKYRRRVKLPLSFKDKVNANTYKRHVQAVSEEFALAAQAAYCAMIEEADRYIGEIRNAFSDFCASRHSKSMFLYVSDHGDQCGDRSIFGKSTFYEKSVKIPMIAVGNGIAADHMVEEPVSIMDVEPTLLEYAGITSMNHTDGFSLLEAFENRKIPEHIVYGEFLEREKMSTSTDKYCFMVRKNNYKYISFWEEKEQDMLFDVDADPDERKNLILLEKDVTEEMRKIVKQYEMCSQAIKMEAENEKNLKLWRAYEKASGTANGEELWTAAPALFRTEPEICIHNTKQKIQRR